jgi:hypothetical protein
MKTLWIFLIVLGLGLSMAIPLSAAMRCDNFSVTPGVHAEEVEANCGEPASKSEGALKGRRGGRAIEKWIYGPEAGFIYILYFSNGVLEEMEEKKAQ